MLLSDETILKHYAKMKIQAKRYIQKENYEAACHIILTAANLAWKTHCLFKDDELDENIDIISDRVLNGFSFDNERNIRSVCFIDWFCMDVRGLGYIYIRALIDKGYYIHYCCPESRRKNVRRIIETLKNYEKAKIYYIDDSTHLSAIRSAAEVLMNSDSKILIANAGDADVVSSSLMKACKNSIISLRISYGDHAFLLGVKQLDYIIEFRDFGIAVSKEKKGIPYNKIIKLPFYPCNIADEEFKGLPFSLEGKKLLVSGGSIYKTMDKDNTFYDMVGQILDRTDNTIFLMLSNSTCKALEELLKKYPQRAYYQRERSDLRCILDRAVLYISTYPVAGGLMSQFAVSCGRIPLTLIKGFDYYQGILLNLKKTNSVFTDKNLLIDEAVRLISDDKYRTECEKALEGQVISSYEFAEQLDNAILHQKTDFVPMECDIDYKALKNLDMSKRGFIEYSKLFVGGRPAKNLKYLLGSFTFLTLCGGFFRLIDKIKSNKLSKG